MEALQVMEEANRIIEDFPARKYAFYIAVFAVEIALCFAIGLMI